MLWKIRLGNLQNKLLEKSNLQQRQISSIEWLKEEHSLLQYLTCKKMSVSGAIFSSTVACSTVVSHSIRNSGAKKKWQSSLAVTPFTWNRSNRMRKKAKSEGLRKQACRGRFRLTSSWVEWFAAFALLNSASLFSALPKIFRWCCGDYLTLLLIVKWAVTWNCW